MAMTEVARATVTIIPNMQGAQQKITQDLTGAAGPAGTAAGNAAGKGIAAAIGNKTSAVGAALTKNITVPMRAVGTASVAAWKSVDAGMDAVAAKTGETGETLTAMQDSVKNLAAQIPTSFENAGNAVGEVYTRFGLTGQALEDLSAQFIKFADLNSTDVSSSIDNVQKALSAFGLGAEDASSLLDTLNAVGQSTGVSMDSLTNGLIQNGTAFQELGLNVDQSVMLMGQLEKSGANSETVMNGLRKALKNAAADGIPLNEALSNLQDSILNGTDSMDGLTAAYDLFGKSGDQIYGAIKNGTLGVSSAFEETKSPIENFQTVLNQLMTIGADIVETVGPMLATALSTVSDVLTKIKGAWDSLSPGTQEAIVKAGLLVAAAGPVISIIGKVIAFAPMLVSGIGTVVTALGPVGIAIAAVIAVGVLLIKHWDEIKAAAQQVWQNVVQTFENIKQSVTEKIDALKSSVQEKFQSIKRSITEPIEKARDAVRSAIEKIKGFFNVTLSFPHIKLPHFRITAGVIPWGIGGKGTPPSIGIDWYDKGGIFNAPTIIGVGERRPEFVGALDDLREIVREESGPTINYGGVTIIINGRNKDAAQLAAELQDELERRTSPWRT